MFVPLMLAGIHMYTPGLVIILEVHIILCRLFKPSICFYHLTCAYVHTIILFLQTSGSAVNEHTGEGKPPLCAMILKADSDENHKTPPKLCLPVTLTGIRAREENLTFEIERLAEGNIMYSVHVPLF